MAVIDCHQCADRFPRAFVALSLSISTSVRMSLPVCLYISLVCMRVGGLFSGCVVHLEKSFNRPRLSLIVERHKADRHRERQPQTETGTQIDRQTKRTCGKYSHREKGYANKYIIRIL